MNDTMDKEKNSDTMAEVKQATVAESKISNIIHADETKTDDSTDNTNMEYSCYEKTMYVLGEITVEPVAFLMIIGIFLSGMVSQTLALEKACRVNLQLPDAVCDALRNQDTDDNSENERLVQAYVANLLGYKSIITSLLPCLLLVFAGGWMDLTGRRKVMMFIPVLGRILLETNNILNVVFFNQLNVEVLIFSEAVIAGILGGQAVLFMAAYCYVTDITSAKNRTYRLGLIGFGISIGTPIGTALSGVLLKSFGYLTVYTIALLLQVVNGCYIIFKLNDPPRTTEHTKHDNRGFVYLMKTFFSPFHFLDALKVLFKKTENSRRIVLCILIVTATLIVGPSYGEGSVLYMSTRYRFNWDELQFSMFQTFNSVVTTIGALFSILCLSKKLGWHDSILGVLSSTSKISASFVYCFARVGTLFFIGAVVDMINATSSVAIRSLLSKTVELHEISKLNSIVGIMEMLMPLIFIPLYTQVYTKTMTVLPGAVFLMSAAITVPPFCAFLWLFYRHRTNVNREGKEKETRL